MKVEQAFVAMKLKQPVVLRRPFSEDVEYKRILNIYGSLPEYNIYTTTAELEDKCGHSVTYAALDKIRLKEGKKNV